MLSKHACLKDGTVVPLLTERTARGIATMMMNDDAQVAQHFLEICAQRGVVSGFVSQLCLCSDSRR